MAQGQGVIAKHGEKMIEVKVRFFTNDIADGKGMILPKHAWGTGEVRISRNNSHKIVPGDKAIFGSLRDLRAKIEQVLINHGITIH